MGELSATLGLEVCLALYKASFAFALVARYVWLCGQMRLSPMSLRWRYFVGLSQLCFCGHCARQRTLPRHHGVVPLVHPWAPSFTHAS